ncbi:unnamed protein product [Scytosiphon promiscuus]
MIVPSDDRQGRKRMRNWRCSVIGAGLSIGLQLLVRADAFNVPPQAPVGGRLSLEQRRGLRSTHNKQWERTAVRRDQRRNAASSADRNRNGSTACNSGKDGSPVSLRCSPKGTSSLESTYDIRTEELPRNLWDVSGSGGAEGQGAGGRTATAGAASTGEEMAAAAKLSVPLKVMVFIDGTWLYYSFFGRGDRCHVSAKLGPGWIDDYKVKWEMLPVIISRALYGQLARFNQPSRLVEVVRTVVFSSARKDTVKDSERMQMFEAMRGMNFEVHMATTVGVQEKCVDIALAVEMMHYATIPDTFDVGVLVTGDKDFMPAMARTRQKGRRICLCTMRNSCNQDLLKDDARVMDFEPVWINEYLDDLVEYDPTSRNAIAKARAPKVAPEVLCHLILKLMDQRGGHISSRELGRELVTTSVDEEGTKALTVIKETWHSITKFLLEYSDVFQIGETRRDPDNPYVSDFTISKVDSQNSMKSLKLGEVKDESVTEAEAGSEDDTAYTDADDDVYSDEEEEERRSNAYTEAQQSLSRELVPQLKERLRGRGLPTSGKKADLIARLLESMAAEAAAARSPSPERHSGSPPRLDPPGPAAAAAATVQGPEVPLGPSPVAAMLGATGGPEPNAGVAGRAGGVGSNNGGVDGLSEGWAAAAADALIAGDFSSSRLEMPGGGGGGGSAGPPAPPEGGYEAEEAARQRRLSGHATLVNLVSEALDNVRASQGAGVVSSRDLGRALASLPCPGSPGQSALILLKSKWPSLMSFLRACPSEFTVTDMGKGKEFGVTKRERRGWEGRGAAGVVEGMGGEEGSHHAPVGVSPVTAEQ